jgi:hypothetical protein
MSLPFPDPCLPAMTGDELRRPARLERVLLHLLQARQSTISSRSLAGLRVSYCGPIAAGT